MESGQINRHLGKWTQNAVLGGSLPGSPMAVSETLIPLSRPAHIHRCAPRPGGRPSLRALVRCRFKEAARASDFAALAVAGAPARTMRARAEIRAVRRRVAWPRVPSGSRSRGQVAADHVPSDGAAFAD